MRSKEEILQRASGDTAEALKSSAINQLHSFQTLEVLIDIRDILAADMKTSIEISKAMAEEVHKDTIHFERRQ